MATGLRIEDRLDGAGNFSHWKARIVQILYDGELWAIVNNTTTNPVTIPADAVVRNEFNKMDIKGQNNPS